MKNKTERSGGEPESFILQVLCKRDIHLQSAACQSVSHNSGPKYKNDVRAQNIECATFQKKVLKRNMCVSPRQTQTYLSLLSCVI